MRGFIVSLVVAVALCGCGGGGPTAPVPVPPHTDAGARTPVAIVIKIPHSAAASSARRTRYVSPATASARIVVKQGGATVIDQTAALTPASPGCVTTPSATQCTIAVALAPGAYAATLTTYDAGSNVLSTGQSVAFTVALGAANTVTIALSGVPAGIRVSAAVPGGTGNAQSGFTVPASLPQTFNAVAVDADGDPIAGIGSPALTVSVVNGSGWSATSPSSANPQSFTVTAPATPNSSATVKVTAAYSDGTCSLPGAVCTTMVSMGNHLQTLFAVLTDRVQVYQPPYAVPQTQIMSGNQIPMTVGYDSTTGDLFVGNVVYSPNIVVYAPPYTGAPIATIALSGDPVGIAFDSHHNLFVSLNQGSVQIYAPPYGSTPPQVVTSTSTAMPPAQLDSADNLFVAEANAISEFAPPYTGGPVATATVVRPTTFALGPNDAISVVSQGGGANAKAYRFAPPYSSATPLSTQTPSLIAMDAEGNTYCGDGATFTISVWGADSTLKQTINHFFNFAGSRWPLAQIMSFDAAGDLFIGSDANYYIQAFTPPFTTAPAVFTDAHDVVDAVLLTP